MRLQLARLAKHHRIAPPSPVMIALTAPVEHSMIVEGYAAVTGLDLTRQRLRPFAFRNSCLLIDQPRPPLYWKHDETKPVGEILSLKYDDAGCVRIKCRVDDPLARRAGAFSIGCVVHKWSLHDETSPDYFALIEQASITEVSLTDVPAQPQCIVTARYPQSARVELLEHAARGIDNIQRQIAILATMAAARPQAPPPPKATPRRVVPSRHAATARRSNDFKMLVEAMQRSAEG
jgi:HK97 family phage prohead protease